MGDDVRALVPCGHLVCSNCSSILWANATRHLLHADAANDDDATDIVAGDESLEGIQEELHRCRRPLDMFESLEPPSIMYPIATSAKCGWCHRNALFWPGDDAERESGT